MLVMPVMVMFFTVFSFISKLLTQCISPIMPQERLFGLLCVLPSRAETLPARLMALRALTRCSLVAPECMTPGISSYFLNIFNGFQGFSRVFEGLWHPRNEFGVEGVACLQRLGSVAFKLIYVTCLDGL